MAAPNSIEVLRTSAANLTLSSAPSGGFTVCGWRKKVSDNYPSFIRLYMTVDGSQIIANAGTNWTNTEFSFDVTGYVNYSPVGTVATTSATITSAQNSDWIWLAVQILPGTTWTIRQWYALGAAGNVVGPVETTFAASTYGLPTSGFSLFRLGQEYSPAVNFTAVRIYSETSAPSVETLTARKNSLSADSAAWADWPLTWTSGAALLTDQSGNGRTLTAAGTMYQGAVGPIDASSGTSYSANVSESVASTESASVSRTGVVSVSETEASAENVSGSAVANQGIGESVGSSEGVGVSVSTTVSVADSESASEGVSSGSNPPASLTDSETVGELASVVVTHAAPVTDAESVAEAVGVSAIKSAAVNEAEGVSDAVATGNAFAAGVSETVSSSEASGTTKTFGVSFSDSVSVGEGGTASTVSGVAVGESEATSEASAAGITAAVGASESVASAEGAGTSASAPVALADTLSASEDTATLAAYAQGVQESTSGSESASASIAGESTLYTADMVDGVGIAEYVAAPLIGAIVDPVVRLLDPVDMIRVLPVDEAASIEVIRVLELGDATPVRVRAVA